MWDLFIFTVFLICSKGLTDTCQGDKLSLGKSWKILAAPWLYSEGYNIGDSLTSLNLSWHSSKHIHFLGQDLGSAMCLSGISRGIILVNHLNFMTWTPDFILQFRVRLQERSGLWILRRWFRCLLHLWALLTIKIFSDRRGSIAKGLAYLLPFSTW